MLKIKDLYLLKSVLDSIKNKGNVKFAYFVAKNLSILSKEIDIISTINKPSDKYNEFLVEKDTLAVKYCNKDENGNPIVKDNMVTFPEENLDIFNKELEELLVKYEDTLKEQNDKDIQVNTLMDNDTDIKLFKVNLNDVPVEGLNYMDLLVNYDLIQE